MKYRKSTKNGYWKYGYFRTKEARKLAKFYGYKKIKGNRYGKWVKA